MTDLAVLIRQLQGALGGRAIRGGSGSVAFPGGSPFSNYTTVDHDLDGVPLAIALTEQNTGVATFGVRGGVTTTATSFQVRARQADGSSPAAASLSFFYWVAIG